ncbi:hypothetical protein [Methanobacterium petrolearium]|uniref:hypothetical protein n=1 Tax=Methanobacterium petrolearium TaxID=710190 RepID=UPI001AE64D9F|nr:hypothetical protein [Methanobacterium petrolearium]MBP1945323.1 hypothetical protein [Methanobacterium petrolearium]BDZ71505.1 hypothetical protein GCM10025861_20220 [Methanobacterium petrolearium]
MREDIKAKAAVALVVSFIAFGCGTGASIFTGLTLDDTPLSYSNNNTSTKLPIIYDVENTTNEPTNTASVVDTSSNSEDVYEENTQSNTQQNQPSTNNTTDNTLNP